MTDRPPPPTIVQVGYNLPCSECVRLAAELRLLEDELHADALLFEAEIRALREQLHEAQTALR